MLQAIGTLSVEPHNGRIVLNVSNDFVQYYSSFLVKRYWILMNTPLHGSHITVYNEKLHKTVNWKKALQYHKKRIEFEYDENMVEGGFHKGFIMFYMKIFSHELETIKQSLNIEDGERYRGLHLTISSAGKSGAKIVNWWPDTITLK